MIQIAIQFNSVNDLYEFTDFNSERIFITQSTKNMLSCNTLASNLPEFVEQLRDMYNISSFTVITE